MSLTVGASSAWTAMNPSAITVPRRSAMRGRSVKLLPLPLRTYSFQFTLPSLFKAPKTSFGNGTTTSSTRFESCFTSIRLGGSTPPAVRARLTTVRSVSLKNFGKDIIRLWTVDFDFYSELVDNSRQNCPPHKSAVPLSLDTPYSHKPQRAEASRQRFTVVPLSFMDLARLSQLLDTAKTKRIVVIGDLMLDEFVWGKVGRISPEAPVPVVEVTRESSYPGGAANVARNLREFVGSTGVIGLLGNDRGGRELRRVVGGGEEGNPARVGGG